MEEFTTRQKTINRHAEQPPAELADWIDEQLERFAGAWTSFNPKIRGDEYGRAFKKLAGEYGCERVERAVQHAVDFIKEFAPTIADLRQIVENMTSTTTRRKYCGKCDEGWIDTTPNDERGFPTGAARCRPCSCRPQPDWMKPM